MNHVQDVAQGASAVNNTQLVLTVPAGVTTTVGNLLVISATGGTSGASVASVADSKGNTYHVDGTAPGGTTECVSQISTVLSAALVAGDTITLTYTAGNNKKAATVAEYTGQAATPLDVAGTAASGSSTSPAASVTATSDGEFVIATLGANAAADTFTAGAGFTATAEGEGGGGTGRSVVQLYGAANAGGTATTAAATLGASDAWCGIAIAYKVAAGATPITVTPGHVSGGAIHGATLVRGPGNLTHVQDVDVNVDSVGDNSIALTVPAGKTCKAGNLLVVSVVTGATAAGGTASDSKGNTYQQDAARHGLVGGVDITATQLSSILTTDLVAGDTISFALGGGLTSAKKVILVSEWANPDTGTRVDTTHTTIGTTGAPNCPLTTGSSNEEVIATLGTGASTDGGLTPVAGFASSLSTGGGTSPGRQINQFYGPAATAGSYTPAATAAPASHEWVMVAVAYRSTRSAAAASNIQPGSIASGGVHGATVTPAGAAPLPAGHVAAGSVHGAAVLASGSVALPAGHVAAGSVHGASLVPSGAALLEPGLVAGGLVHGATLQPAGAVTIQPGHVAGSVHGAALAASGAAAVTPGHVAGGAVHGASLHAGVGMIHAGHVAAGQVHGAALQPTGGAAIHAGHVAGQVHGAQLVAAGAATVTPGHVTGGQVHGAALTAGTGLIRAGRVTAGSRVGGASLAPSGASPLAVGHVGGGIVRGARVREHVDVGALYFGISINAGSDEDYEQYVDGGVGPSGTSYPGLVAEMGRQFAGTRQNLSPSTAGITGPERTAYAQGRLIQYRHGTPTPVAPDTATSGTFFASVAAGNYDDVFLAFFAEIQADPSWTADVPYIYCWCHEYYTDHNGGVGHGTAAEFVAASQRVWTLLRGSGAHVLDGGNMRLAHVPHYRQLMWDETYGDPTSYGGVTSQVEAYTITKTDPGAGYYDYPGADVYLDAGQTYTAADQLNPLIAWATAVGKPWIIGEYGIDAGGNASDGAADVAYLDAMDTVLRGCGAGDSAGQCLAIFWTIDSDTAGDTNVYQPDANPERLAWFQAALADPFYSRMPALPGLPVTTIHVTLDTAAEGLPVTTIHVSLVTTTPAQEDRWLVEVAWQDAASGVFTIGRSIIGGPDVLAGLFNPPAYIDVTGESFTAEIQRGRPDATSDVQAGVLDLQLVDDTGRYNVANPESDLYGLIDAGRPARVSRIWQGETYRLYTGFAGEVIGPQENDQPYATLNASDLLERLSVEKPVVNSTGLTTTGGAIKAILDAIGWTQTSLDTGDQVADFSADGSQDALSLIGGLLDVERGSFYIAGDGTATYVNHLGRQELRATIRGLQLISSGVSIRNVANRASVTREGGKEQVYEDVASRQRYGQRDADGTPVTSTYLVSDAQALTVAERIVTLAAEAQGAVFQLAIQGNPEGDPDTYTLLCALDLGDRISVVDPGSGTVGDYTIEGVTHNISAGGLDHSVTWVLRERVRGVFIIGQSVIGGPDRLAA